MTSDSQSGSEVSITSVHTFEKNRQMRRLITKIFDEAYREGLRQAPAALERLAEQMSEPPRPIMSQQEFERLPKFEKSMLICNYIGCGNVVCTHGLLCVEHTLEMSYGDYSIPISEY
jgi:hypothetical protein